MRAPVILVPGSRFANGIPRETAWARECPRRVAFTRLAASRGGGDGEVGGVAAADGLTARADRRIDAGNAATPFLDDGGAAVVDGPLRNVVVPKAHRVLVRALVPRAAVLAQKLEADGGQGTRRASGGAIRRG
eukprot:1599471-Pleurochrysis_carterae.AAC.2